MTNMKFLIILIAPLHLFSRTCFAQESAIITDRPDFTESAATVPASRVQLEGGYTFSRAGEVREHALGEILVRVGVAEDLEFRLGLNSYAWNLSPSADVSGFKDATIGAKWSVYNDREDRISFSVLAATTLPTGGKEFREDALQPEAKFIVAWGMTDRQTISANLNTTAASIGGKRFALISGSLSLGQLITDVLGAYAEVFGFLPQQEGAPDAYYLNGGMTWLISADVQLDARVGGRLNGSQPDFFAGVGAGWRW